MARFADVHIAAKLRDAIRNIAHGELNRVHPADSFGHVSDIDEIAGTIKYRMPGSTQDLVASYGFGDPPDIGKPVRITGRAGSRYVVGMSAAVNLDDVITTTPGDVTGVPISDLPVATTPDGSELVVLVQGGITKRSTVSAITAGGGSLWEIVTGANNFLQPIDTGFDAILLGDENNPNTGIQGVDSHSDTHETYLMVSPGIGSGGGDIQAETLVVGKDAIMDWFYWSRHQGGSAFEAGSFWDAIGDDGAGVVPEAFFEVYATGNLAIIELSVDPGDGGSESAEFDVVADPVNNWAYYHFYGQNSFLKFGRTSGAATLDVAPDAALASKNWSLGYDQSTNTFTIKVNDGGTIKTWTTNPT